MEDAQSEGPELEYYFRRYGDLDLHRRMVGDRARTEAFGRALAESVTAADVVLDFGTGTGILAMLAAKAGAKKVYAVDRASVVEHAARLVDENGLAGVVEVLRATAETLELPQKVDVLVSEWLGNFGIVEAMLEDVLVARDRHLSAYGRMIPRAVELMLAPLDDAVSYAAHGPGFWRRPVLGLDLSSLEAAELQQGRGQPMYLEDAALLAPGKPMVRLDLLRGGPEDAFVDGRVVFTAQRAGMLSGFAGWFLAELSDNARIDTAPGRTATHWAQTFLPFSPHPVDFDELVAVDFQIRRDLAERRSVRVDLEAFGQHQSYLIE